MRRLTKRELRRQIVETARAVNDLEEVVRRLVGAMPESKPKDAKDKGFCSAVIGRVDVWDIAEG